MSGEYVEVGSLKSWLKKKMGKGKNKPKAKVTKPALLTTDAAGGVQQRLPLGMPVVTFVNLGPTVLRSTVNPQKPFMARRLIIDEARAGLLGVLPTAMVLLTGFRIGTDEMFAGQGAIPIIAFANNSTGMTLMTRAARPGLEISLTFELAGAPLIAGETITVAAVLMGDAVAQ